jgi:dTDP-4-dehydrorhamnose reductase
VAGDARDTDAVASLIKDGRFDAVINCIGILNQFAEQNKALATFLNAYFPHFLAGITSGTETQCILRRAVATSAFASGHSALKVAGS